MSRSLTYNFSGYDGWDVFLSLLPKKRQTKIIARRLLQSLTPRHGEMPNLKETPVILNLPWGSFRIMNLAGAVEPCAREYIAPL